MQALNAYLKSTSTKSQAYQNYHTHALALKINSKDQISDQDLQKKVNELFEWAKILGAKYFTFFAYPQNQGILEKQETFLDLEYSYNYTLQNKGSMKFAFKSIKKGESDGSSFPSGSLRQTSRARAYTVWDIKSEVFINPKSNVLYIPSFLVSHYGQALDDKTIFRRSQKKLEDNTIKLLQKLGIKTQSVVMALGLEQQFFVMKRDAYLKRLDLKQAGRALAGKLPPKTQQFSDHYYGKIPYHIQQILTQIQGDLLKMGIPVKMRHQEVAPNQFQFVPLFNDAGKTIDHNMIMMQIFKQRFEKAGLTALFHQKPFHDVNGSGKHCNWSLNYINQQGKMKNLFEPPSKNQLDKILIFKLFVLIQLRALLKHSKLYLSSIATPGNELRLGGHQAPPRILSAFLGDAVSALILDQDVRSMINLKQNIPNINFDVHQENTDRNRTSPYAFTGNKFEYRAVGSSQNVCFPMSVIAATLAKQIQVVTERLEKGESIEDIIISMRDETNVIIFNGDGYSSSWIEQADMRGLYVNKQFYENYENIVQGGKVFSQLGILKENQIIAKSQNMKALYKNTVINESNTLKHIMSSQIIPRCYEFAKLVKDGPNYIDRVQRRTQKFLTAFQELLDSEQKLNEWKCTENLKSYSDLRKLINQTSFKINSVLEYLPKSKDWPQFQDFIGQY